MVAVLIKLVVAQQEIKVVNMVLQVLVDQVEVLWELELVVLEGLILYHIQMMVLQIGVIQVHQHKKMVTQVVVEDQEQEKDYQVELMHLWLVQVVVLIDRVVVDQMVEQVMVEEMEEIMVVMDPHLEVVVDQMVQVLEVSVGL